MGRGVGGQLPPGPVELDKLSLWMGLFSLETVKSVILIVVTCNCLSFLWREIGWSTVCAIQIVRKRKQTPLLKLALILTSSEAGYGHVL